MIKKSKFHHIVPKTNNFIKDKNKLLKLLSENMSFDRYGKNFNPYPIAIDDDIIDQVEEANNIIIIALDAIIKNYITDKKVQNIVKLENKALKILQKYSKNSYKLGSIRPDFLVSTDNQIKICEINTRFPFNGIFGSNFLQQAYNKLGKSDYISINQDPNIIALVLKNFDLTKPIFILRDREQGYDINFLENILKNDLTSRQKKISLTPSELKIANGKLLFNGQVCEQFIIELHQDELLSLSDDFLIALINTNHINDLRTLLIGHDKRMLAVFSNQDIMLQYISMAEFNLLNKYIIPTYLPNNEINKEILVNKDSWVLKKYRGGKGIGMYVGNIHSVATINNVLKNNSDAYIIQPYVHQNKIPLFVEYNNNIACMNMHIVGCFANFNKNFLSIGFFRASLGDIVNVSEQGGNIIHVVKKNHAHKKHIITKLNYIISYAKKHSKYYSTTLPADKITTLEQVSQLPILTSSMLKQHASNAQCGLLTNKLAFCHVFSSGTTTGTPKFIFRSHQENNTNAKMLAKGLKICGLQKHDIVANLLASNSLWSGMTIFNLVLTHIGCCILGVGKDYTQEFLIDIIRRFNVTTLLGMPTQIATLAHYIEEKNIKDICIPRIIIGGEYLYKDAKKYIKKILKIKHIQSTGYTSSDTGAIGYQCVFCKDNEYHLHSNMQHLEILNLNNSKPAPLGNKGRIVVTNLDRTLMPLIRYESGDLGKILNKDCKCNSTDLKFQLLGRGDDNIIVGPKIISIEYFAKAIAKFKELALSFQVIINNTNGTDHITIICEIKNQTKISAQLKQDLYNEILAITTIKHLINRKFISDIFINIVAYGSISRNHTTGKIRNIIDERK
jgi:phenylacetate-coenzyme A ligase PaaK-like adenylate-forming protein